MCKHQRMERVAGDQSEPFPGNDPIGYAALPFSQAELVMHTLATTEADVWGDWYLGAGLVDPGVIRSGGPAARDEIWAGVLRAVDADWFGSCTWDELVVAGRVPLWARVKPGFEPYFGAVGCWVTAGFLACTCRWMQGDLGATWVLPPDLRGDDGRSEPVISTPGHRGILPLTQFVSTVGRAVGLVPERVNREPGRLRELIELHRMTPEELAAAALDGELVGPRADPTDEPGHWMIGFSDMQAHDEDERVDRFAVALALADGVDRAFREDRELVVAESAMEQSSLQAVCEQVWADCAIG